MHAKNVGKIDPRWKLNPKLFAQQMKLNLTQQLDCIQFHNMAATLSIQYKKDKRNKGALR